MAQDAGVGGNVTEYSASIKTQTNQQDYDLDTLIQEAADSGVGANGDAVDFAGLVGSKKLLIKKVFYKTPHAMWRFYGYYGGLNTVGNLSTMDNTQMTQLSRSSQHGRTKHSRWHSRIRFILATRTTHMS